MRQIDQPRRKNQRAGARFEMSAFGLISLAALGCRERVRFAANATSAQGRELSSLLLMPIG